MSDYQLVSLQAGLPMAYTRPGGRPEAWSSGLVKSPVSGPAWLGRTNLAGDGQGDLVNHGGPDKAVNAYASEHYAAWHAELDLPALAYGGFGENFTTGGLLEDAVCIGDVYAVGEAQVQVSQPRQPCWKLDHRWGLPDLAERVRAAGRTGWYFRVLVEGHVEAGQPVILQARPYPQWTIHVVNAVILRQQTDPAVLAGLVACPALAVSLRDYLARRPAERGA